MRFYAPCATPHRNCRLLGTEIFQHTQQERLALAFWQPVDRRVQHAQRLVRASPFFRAWLRRVGRGCNRIQPLRVLRALVQVHHRPPHSPSAIPVRDSIIEDPVEQRRPFGLCFVRIAPDQFQHGILHQVQRFVRITRRVACDPESPALHILQKRLHSPSLVQLAIS